LGAWDDDPAIEPFTRKFEIPERPLEAILDDRDVSIVLIHSKSHLMVPLASSALHAGKAVLAEAARRSASNRLPISMSAII
jgi:predicted dehydrogenase